VGQTAVALDPRPCFTHDHLRHFWRLLRPPKVQAAWVWHHQNDLKMRSATNYNSDVPFRRGFQRCRGRWGCAVSVGRGPTVRHVAVTHTRRFHRPENGFFHSPTPG